MPSWANSLVSLIVIALFVLAVFGLAASTYGDLVREFYARRDKLQTLFDDDTKTGEKSNED
jgi:hypothetical protein